MMKEWTAGLVWGGSGAAVSLGAAFAHRLGYIDSDTVMRLAFGVNGLLIAWYGNRMPKAMVPRTRPATRVTGWALALSGLAYAALWAFAPMRVAIFGGTAAVFTGVLVSLGYCLSIRDHPRGA